MGSRKLVYSRAIIGEQEQDGNQSQAGDFITPKGLIAEMIVRLIFFIGTFVQKLEFHYNATSALNLKRELYKNYLSWCGEECLKENCDNCVSIRLFVMPWNLCREF